MNFKNILISILVVCQFGFVWGAKDTTPQEEHSYTEQDASGNVHGTQLKIAGDSGSYEEKFLDGKTGYSVTAKLDFTISGDVATITNGCTSSNISQGIILDEVSPVDMSEQLPLTATLQDGGTLDVKPNTGNADTTNSSDSSENGGASGSLAQGRGSGQANFSGQDGSSSTLRGSTLPVQTSANTSSAGSIAGSADTVKVLKLESGSGGSYVRGFKLPDGASISITPIPDAKAYEKPVSYATVSEVFTWDFAKETKEKFSQYTPQDFERMLQQDWPVFRGEFKNYNEYVLNRFNCYQFDGFLDYIKTFGRDRDDFLLQLSTREDLLYKLRKISKVQDSGHLF